MELKAALARLFARQDLDADETAAVFGAVMDGQATPAQIGALLAALRMKGETVGEVVGAARAMRSRAVRLPWQAPAGAVVVDTCGTGGDGCATINISTIAALAVAACGVRVAKHGNRAVSSRAGSADVLEALGVEVACTPEAAARCLDQVGIAFLFAPAYHGATRHAAGPRKELGTRTIFNVLGPLTNPAGASRQVIGVFEERWCQPLACALGELGSERALVVHGAGGLDEIAPAGPTQVAELEPGGRVRTYTLAPREFGLPEHDPAGLRGGDVAANAEAARAILAGGGGAGRAAVVMAAGATLVVAGRAPDWAAGARQAEAALDDGRAAATLAALVRASRSAT
ncbi:MAG TPA: anthranilate phosphoribosyltransferase [Polyangia bacterium]|nr:anthranilate phosphoribosyltransferase [Polyangia bacterium]